MANPQGRGTGFTLIELLVTIAIFAIVATIAAPALTSLVDRNTLAARTNAVNSILRAARNEAVRSAQRVTVTYDAQSQTLLVASEEDDELLRQSEPLRGVVLAISGDITFSPEGALLGPDDIVHFEVARHESRWICVFRSGIIARVGAEGGSSYCNQPT